MGLFPVPDVLETRGGDDLIALVSERINLRPDDMVYIASTVVSGTEGRFADLDDFPADSRACELAARLAELTGDEKDPRFVQAILEESIDLIMSKPFLLTETRFGHVGINAGTDRSNVPDRDLLLLPKHPSESAERIRAGIDTDRVVVTDACGRPFRHGQRGVTIDWADLSASRDWRGKADRGGHELGVAVESVMDELAAATDLVQGKGDGGTPVVAVRDFEWGDHDESSAHFRDTDGDFVQRAPREWHYDLQRPA